MFRRGNALKDAQRSRAKSLSRHLASIVVEIRTKNRCEHASRHDNALHHTTLHGTHSRWEAQYADIDKHNRKTHHKHECRTLNITECNHYVNPWLGQHGLYNHYAVHVEKKHCASHSLLTCIPVVIYICWHLGNSNLAVHSMIPREGARHEPQSIIYWKIGKCHVILPYACKIYDVWNVTLQCNFEVPVPMLKLTLKNCIYP